jgi:transposase
MHLSLPVPGRDHTPGTQQPRGDISMAQRRRTSEQWRELVTGWPRSGLTQQAYCERHGISPGSLQRWREVFRQERAHGQEQAAAAVRLVPVHWVETTPAHPAPLILVLSDGRRLEIAPEFDTGTLKRLLLVLQEAA